jgi:hypothetical protein
METPDELVARLLDQQAETSQALARLLRDQAAARRKAEAEAEAFRAETARHPLAGERLQANMLDLDVACRLLGIRAATPRGQLRALKRECGLKHWLIRLSSRRYKVNASGLEAHIAALPAAKQRRRARALRAAA